MSVLDLDHDRVEEVAFQVASWCETKKAGRQLLSKVVRKKGGCGDGALLGINTGHLKQIGDSRRLDIIE